MTRSLADLGAEVGWPDLNSAAAVKGVLADRPQLGRLAEFVRFLAGMQYTTTPTYPERVRVLVLGGKPCEPVGALADSLGVGIRYEAAPAGEIDAAVEAGAALADAEIDAGTELIVFAAPSGEPATAAAVVAAICSVEPAKVLARGATAAEPGPWMAQAERVRDHRRIAMLHRDDPQAALRALKAPTLAFAAGFLLRATSRRTAIILDGALAAAAALLAAEVAAPAGFWWLAADLATDPATKLAHDRLNLEPVLQLGICTADGTAGLLCVPVLRAAVSQAGNTDFVPR